MANRHQTERRHEVDDEARQEGHHPADERHTNDYGNAADKDRKRRAQQQTDRDQSQGHHRDRAERPNHDETGHGHANRWGSNRTTDAGASERSESGHQSRKTSGRESHDTGSPHTGSQRGSHREEGISGRMTGQRGESSHHSDPRDSTFREDREHRHGGRQGTSERDHRYGSRRGHGTERRDERRSSSE